MMSYYLKTIKRVLAEFISSIAYFLVNNLKYFIELINVLIPYMYGYMTVVYYIDGNDLSDFSPFMLFPVISIIMLKLIKSFINKIGHGDDIPVPRERFTKMGDSGTVTIDNSSIHELILYTYNLEEYLKYKGYTEG